MAFLLNLTGFYYPLFMTQFANTLEFAKQLDAQDPLKAYRDKFLIPQHNGHDMVYFTGNSLGLQPKSTKDYLQQELDDWAKLAWKGIFWLKIHG